MLIKGVTGLLVWQLAVLGKEYPMHRFQDRVISVISNSRASWQQRFSSIVKYFRLIWKCWWIKKNKKRAGSLQYCIFSGNYGFCYMGRLLTGPPSSNGVHFVGSVQKNFLELTCRDFPCLCSFWWGCLSKQTVHRWHQANWYFKWQTLP